ncbi:lytic murein transglycosylase [Phenylobacterium sp.]|uniref:lytic murein transglycosylase n=1 Tax=Phenylobacterium sp. TaxID=1871053 RepID=UPI0035AE30D4
MHRRAFLSLLLAALPGASAAQTADPTAQPLAGASPSGSPAFDAWLQGFYGRAAAAGVPAVVLDRELAGLTPDDRVSAADGRQPEFSKPVGDYIKGVVTDQRIAMGRQKRQELTFLGDVEARYGVPRDILIAVWAMESAFGAIQGNYDVVRSMATLAADGRRRAFAETQLIAALQIIASGEFPRSRLTGSWAGAMGQTQFIPTTFQTTAVDEDGDGRRDIWGSAADALASAANLLSQGGWAPGQSWAREVLANPGFDYALTEGPSMAPAAWELAGLRRADGGGWAAQDQTIEATLIAPSGAAGPLFLAFPNHFAIRKYNNSTAYALGVGLLADRFAGGGPLIAAWPAETPLALADRIDAQKALARLGFDPGAPDGLVGVNTRSALRAWQQARGLTADGYLSMEMVRRLRAESPDPAQL